MNASDEITSEGGTDTSSMPRVQMLQPTPEYPEQEQVDARYESGKPRRVIIRARITHGEH